MFTIFGNVRLMGIYFIIFEYFAFWFKHIVKHEVHIQHILKAIFPKHPTQIPHIPD